MGERNKDKDKDKEINKENQEHRVGQKRRLDIACHSAWWTQISNANKLLIILLIYLTLLNWTISSTARPASSSTRPVRIKANHRNYSLFSLSKVPTNTKQIRLYCRIGLFLSMDGNGTVSGVLLTNGTQEVFELQSFGPSIVSIKHKATGFFITMNSKGKVKGRKKAVSSKADNYFYLNQEENNFVSFASFHHKKKKKKKKKFSEMFLGIKRGGEVKNGRQTHAGQDSIEFLELDISS